MVHFFVYNKNRKQKGVFNMVTFFGLLFLFYSVLEALG